MQVHWKGGLLRRLLEQSHVPFDLPHARLVGPALRFLSENERPTARALAGRSRRAHPLVAARAREANRIARGELPAPIRRAQIRISRDDRDVRLAPRPQARRDDRAARVRVFVLRGLEDSTGVARQAFVAECLDGITEQGVHRGPRTDARVERRERLDVAFEIAARWRWIFGGLDPRLGLELLELVLDLKRR